MRKPPPPGGRAHLGSDGDSREADGPIRLKDDDESASRPMNAAPQPRRFPVMNHRLLILLLALGLVVLAVGGWAVDGVRWLLTGSRSARPGVATA
jgi:hypothetical protein